MILGERSPDTAGHSLIGEFRRTVNEILYHTKIYKKHDVTTYYTIVTNDIVVQNYLQSDDYVRWSCMGLEDGTTMR